MKLTGGPSPSATTADAWGYFVSERVVRRSALHLNDIVYITRNVYSVRMANMSMKLLTGLDLSDKEVFCSSINHGNGEGSLQIYYYYDHGQRNLARCYRPTQQPPAGHYWVKSDNLQVPRQSHALLAEHLELSEFANLSNLLRSGARMFLNIIEETLQSRTPNS
jgi:hypothetical protein